MWLKDKPKKQVTLYEQQKAWKLFESWAIANNRTYMSDMVKGNLNASLSAGRTPLQALQDLIERIPN